MHTPPPDTQAIPITTGLDWPTLAGDVARTACVASLAPLPSLAQPAWRFPSPGDPSLAPWLPIAHTTPVVAGRTVCVIAQHSSTHEARLFALSRATGLPLWSAPLDPLVLDSWSSPSIDLAHWTVIAATGRTVRCFDLTTGSPLWTLALPRDTVNATPAIATGPGTPGRAFVTDYQGFFTGGDGGSLHCINLAPRNPATNPFDPGQLVWSVPLRSGLSGASPAYADGTVVIATAGDFDSAGPGSIVAFDATSVQPPQPLWAATPAPDEGFFGGVGIAPRTTAGGTSPTVLAATYDFFGGRDNSTLAAIDLHTGAILATSPAERSATIPVILPGGSAGVAPGGSVLLAAGLPGFGSSITVQRFQQLSAPTPLARLWDSADATWLDADANGQIDPGEALDAGGWNIQPLVILDSRTSPARTLALVGGLPPSPFSVAPGSVLRLVDPAAAPADPGFVVDQTALAGGPPAVATGNVYSIGPAGLVAFGAFCPADLDGDADADIFDIFRFFTLFGAASPRAEFGASPASRDVFDVFGFFAAFAAGCA